MVTKFLDDVYNGLCDDDFTLDVPQDLARALGMLQPPTQEHQHQPTTSLQEELEPADTLVSILPDQPVVKETAVIVDTKNSDGVMQATEVDGHKVFYTVENFSHSSSVVTDSKKDDPDENQRYVVSADNRKRRLPPVRW